MFRRKHASHRVAMRRTEPPLWKTQIAPNLRNLVSNRVRLNWRSLPSPKNNQMEWSLRKVNSISLTSRVRKLPRRRPRQKSALIVMVVVATSAALFQTICSEARPPPSTELPRVQSVKQARWIWQCIKICHLLPPIHLWGIRSRTKLPVTKICLIQNKKIYLPSSRSLQIQSKSASMPIRVRIYYLPPIQANKEDDSLLLFHQIP